MNRSFLSAFVKCSLWLQGLGQSEDGQGVTEYALILSFVVILLIVLLFVFGAEVELTYRDILDLLPF